MPTLRVGCSAPTEKLDVQAKRDKYYKELVSRWGNEQENCHECMAADSTRNTICSNCSGKLECVRNIARLFERIRVQEELDNDREGIYDPLDSHEEVSEPDLPARISD